MFWFQKLYVYCNGHTQLLISKSCVVTSTQYSALQFTNLLYYSMHTVDGKSQMNSNKTIEKIILKLDFFSNKPTVILYLRHQYLVCRFIQWEQLVLSSAKLHQRSPSGYYLQHTYCNNYCSKYGYLLLFHIYALQKYSAVNDREREEYHTSQSYELHNQDLIINKLIVALNSTM